MKLKGWSALASVLLLTTVMSACGSSNDDNGGTNNAAANGNAGTANNGAANDPAATNDGAAANDGSANAPADGGAKNDKEFTIRVGAWFLDERPYMVQFKKSVEEAYAKLYPKAKIQWDVVLGATYFDKLRAQFASGSAPDVVFYQNVDFAKAGNLVDLSAEPWVARLNDGGQKDFRTHAGGKTVRRADGTVDRRRRLVQQEDVQRPRHHGAEDRRRNCSTPPRKSKPRARRRSRSASRTNGRRSCST